MFRNKLWQGTTLLIVLSMVLVSCAGDTEGTPEVVGGFEIPTVEEGKFNVAMVLIGAALLASRRMNVVKNLEEQP